MAVVKANAYGHGLVPVATAAAEAGAERLGVALLSEAVALRKAGLALPIHILSETTLNEVDFVVRYNLTPTVYSEQMLLALAKAAQKSNWPLRLHLKVDTGMHRVGSGLEKTVALYQRAKKYPQLIVEGIFTHFACADDPENKFTQQQLAALLSLKSQIKVPIWHAANSGATIYLPETHLNMVRVGISMYGLQPGAAKLPLTLKPALSLKAKITLLKNVNKGDGVSYCLTYKAKDCQLIGVVPLGYGDGYSRRLSNKAYVLVNGQRFPVVGNICMDQLMVAFPDKTQVSVGDEVVLIGKQNGLTITAEELAALSETINYEIVCGLNERLPRVYVQ